MKADAADQAETDRLVAWHVEQLGFGPADTARRQQQTEQAQLERWGVSGFAILAIDEDAELARLDAEWEASDVTADLIDLIGRIAAAG